MTEVEKAIEFAKTKIAIQGKKETPLLINVYATEYFEQLEFSRYTTERSEEIERARLDKTS